MLWIYHQQVENVYLQYPQERLSTRVYNNVCRSNFNISIQFEDINPDASSYASICSTQHQPSFTNDKEKYEEKHSRVLCALGNSFWQYVFRIFPDSTNIIFVIYLYIAWWFGESSRMMESAQEPKNNVSANLFYRGELWIGAGALRQKPIFRIWTISITDRRWCGKRGWWCPTM